MLLLARTGCFEGSAESARAWLEVDCFGYSLGARKRAPTTGRDRSGLALASQGRPESR